LLIDGIHIPLTVPFTRDGALFLSKLEYNVRRYSLTPAAGLVAALGEGAALSDAELREMLAVIGQTATAEKVLVVAVAKESVRGALAVAEEAAAAGFDAVLLSAPSGVSEHEMMLHFETVADASPLPVLVGSALPLEVMAELAQHPNVIGAYEEGLTLERYRALMEVTKGVKREVVVTTVFAPVTRRMRSLNAEEPANFVTAASLSGAAVVAMPAKPAVKTRTKVVGFQVMAAGTASQMVELLDAGVAGAMPTLAACAPQGCFEAFAAFKDGDPALASEKEQRLVEADRLMASFGIAEVKYGCDWNGYFGGAPRPPRLALDAEQRLVVERVLAGLRN
jgi:4-hydroxy-2-oxoglutarate aldolase